MLATASQAVAAEIAASYDPAQQREYDKRSWCPDLLGTPPVMELLTRTQLAGLLETCFGTGRWEHDGGQIALRRPGTCAVAAEATC